MGFVIAVLYLTLTHLSVADIVPWLAPFRIMWVLAVLGVVSSALALVSTRLPMTTPQILLMVALVGWIGVAWLLHGWAGGAFQSVLKFLPSAIVFFLVVCNVTTPGRVRVLMMAMLSVAFYHTVLGVKAFWSGDRTHPRIFMQRVYDSDVLIQTVPRVRATGILQDPNDLAQYLITMLPFLGLFWRARRPLRNAVLVIAPAAVLFYGLYLTGSRGALAGLVVLVILATKDYFNKAATAAVAVAVALGLVLLGYGAGRTVSFSAGLDRINIWSEGLGMFKRFPIWGVGFGAFTSDFAHTAHNSFLLCLAELGLVGYFLWLGLVVLTLLQLTHLTRLPAEGPQQRLEIRRLARIVYIAFGAYLASSFFLSRTYEPVFYMFFALTLALYHMSGIRPNEMPAKGTLLDRFSWPVLTVMGEVATVALLYISVRLR